MARRKSERVASADTPGLSCSPWYGECLGPGGKVIYTYRLRFSKCPMFPDERGDASALDYYSGLQQSPEG